MHAAWPTHKYGMKIPFLTHTWTSLPFHAIPYRYTVSFDGTVYDRPFGHAVRRLDAGETLEVVDWRPPFVRLANDAGFVLDANFDGHLSMKRWAPQKSGTVLRLHNLKPEKPRRLPSPRATDMRARPSTTTRLMTGLSPDAMYEEDLKSEVRLGLASHQCMPRFLFLVSHPSVVACSSLLIINRSGPFTVATHPTS